MGARDRLAGGGLTELAAVFENRAGRGDSGSIDHLAYPTADRYRDASEGVFLGSGVAGDQGLPKGRGSVLGIV
jgi:hypothetical protein